MNCTERPPRRLWRHVSQRADVARFFEILPDFDAPAFGTLKTCRHNLCVPSPSGYSKYVPVVCGGTFPTCRCGALFRDSARFRRANVRHVENVPPQTLRSVAIALLKVRPSSLWRHVSNVPMFALFRDTARFRRASGRHVENVPPQTTPRLTTPASGAS